MAVDPLQRIDVTLPGAGRAGQPGVDRTRRQVKQLSDGQCVQLRLEQDKFFEPDREQFGSEGPLTRFGAGDAACRNSKFVDPPPGIGGGLLHGEIGATLTLSGRQIAGISQYSVALLSQRLQLGQRCHPGRQRCAQRCSEPAAFCQQGRERRVGGIDFARLAEEALGLPGDDFNHLGRRSSSNPRSGLQHVRRSPQQVAQ